MEEPWDCIVVGAGPRAWVASQVGVNSDDRRFR